MKTTINLSSIILCIILIFNAKVSIGQTAINPVIHADVPDMSIIRVGSTYYMSSTTMHMNPGVPIMKSKDLINWELISYCYDTLGDIPELNLTEGKSTYGRGSWASCIRHSNNKFYVSTFAQTTGKTYIFSTDDIEKGKWETKTFEPSCHDHSILYDEDGHNYIIWGGGKIHIAELKNDLSGIIEGTERILIENASAPSGDNIGLPAEGSQLFKINGIYYLVNITWPKGGMRTVVIHRADNINGPWEGRVALQDKGVAQGGLIDTPDGKWYAYLFRDNGSVGRIPYLVPVTWKDGWPVIGIDGKVPMTLDLPASKGLIPGIVSSDDFKRKKKEAALPLVWQWNHNPENSLWSVDGKKGFLRLKTNRIDNDFLLARNTLTQRTIGPECSGSTSINISGIKDGDFSGLSLLQKKYGLVGVKKENGKSFIVMVSSESGEVKEMERIPITGNKVYLKAECDFNELRDVATFYFSLNGKDWNKIGSQLKMSYTIPQFMGYRYGLFYYSSINPGGEVDFDYFKISNKLTEKESK